MTQQPGAGPETSKWPHTRQDFPITTPPVPGIHTASPSAPPSGWLTQNTTFPLGLASLTHLESIFIDSYVKPFEAVLGHNRKNKYVLMADKGEWLFDVQEDSSLCSRICWGNGREMEFKFFDRSRQEVLRFHHPFALVLGKLDVYAGSRRLGSVHHKWALYPKVEVRDDAGKPLFTIEGEACQCDCKSVKDFQVYSSDKSRQIGLITKQWLGIQRRLVSCGAFNVSFPVDLDVELKVLLIASAIHLDHAYFQRNVDVM